MTQAIIGATNVLCSIGAGCEQVWASARAGIARISSSHVMDRHFEAIQMGLVPEDQLPPLSPEVDVLGLPPRARRILRLAAPTLASVAKDFKQPIKLLIGLPELSVGKAPWIGDFLPLLAQASNVQLDVANSVAIPRGRASALLALEQALQAIAAEPNEPVVVGGVDTFLDLRLLAELDAEQRILGAQVMDGFIPGEGAGFFVLHSPAHVGAIETATVESAASVSDSGHRYGSEPAKGEGLANAIDLLRGGLQRPCDPVGATFAGFNGENFDAKLWGVARLRHSDLFAPTMSMEHPADRYADAGAATGALLVVLAATALARRQRHGPALVWAASDTEMRACALLSVAQSS